MKFAVYKGTVVQVDEVFEATISIREDSTPAIVQKDDVFIIPEGINDDLMQDLDSTKIHTSQLVNRMHRLQEEYTKKMESLREMYLDSRSEEMKIINKIIKNSQDYCQK